MALFPPLSKNDPRNHPQFNYPPGRMGKNPVEEKDKTGEETLLAWKTKIPKLQGTVKSKQTRR